MRYVDNENGAGPGRFGSMFQVKDFHLLNPCFLVSKMRTPVAFQGRSGRAMSSERSLQSTLILANELQLIKESRG